MAIEYDRLIAYFDGDISGIQKAGREATRIVDNLETRIKNFKAGLKINTITGNSGGADSAMKKAQADIRRMQSENARAEKEITRSVEREAKLQADAKIREQRRAANEMIASIKRVQREEKSGSKGSSSGIGGSVLKGSFIGSAAGNIAAAALSHTIDLAKQGAEVWLDYSANLEQTKIGFTTLLGSSQAAEAHLKDLQNFAKTTPFEFAELTQASRRFQGVGVEAAKVIPLLTDIGNAAAAAGASSEKLKLITVAFAQIIAKGKLSAEEVNQLAENGIPAWDILSKQLNKTKAEVIKMAEAGEISSDIFLAAFQKFSQQNYGDAMQKQSRTFLGAMSNITDILLQVSNTALAPLFEKISSIAVEFADEIQKQGNDLEAVGNTIGKYIGKGLGVSLAYTAKGIGAFLGKAITASSKDNPVDIFFRNIGISFFKEFGFNEQDFKDWGWNVDDFTKKIQSQFQDKITLGGKQFELDTTNFTLKEIKQTVQSTPDLAGKLKTGEAQKEAEKLRDLIADLKLEVAFYGNSSQEAAVKQKLLKDGISDFNSSLARSAISLARQLDDLKRLDDVGKTIADLTLKMRFYGDETEVSAVKQRLLSQGITDLTTGSAQAALTIAAQIDAFKKADEQKKKIEDLRKEIVKLGEDAKFDVQFPNANELDRFNRWVKDNASAFRVLSPEIAKTREELEKLLFYKGVGERNDAVTNYLENLRQTIRSFSETGAELDFEKVLAGLVKPLKLEKSTSPINPEDFAKRIREEILSFGAKIQSEKELADGLIGDPERIKQELEKRLGTITDRFYEFMDGFLSQFKKRTEDGKLVNIFADAADFENIAELINLYNSLSAAKYKASLAGRTEFSAQSTEREFEAERERIEMLKSFGAEKETIRQAELELSKRKADFDHKIRLAEIERQKTDLLALTQYEFERVNIITQYNRQIEAETLRHNAVLGQITADFGNRSIADNLRRMVSELPSFKQQYQDFITSLPSSLSDSFSAGLSNLQNGWRGFLDAMKQSFAQTLLDLTNQLIRSALIKLLANLLGSLFTGGGGLGPASSVGVASGGGAGLPGLAAGGTAYAGMAHVIGERGPEIFVPNQTGTVINNRETKKLLADRGGDTYNISYSQTIHAPRGLVQPKSARQAADAGVSALARLTKK